MMNKTDAETLIWAYRERDSVTDWLDWGERKHSIFAQYPGLKTAIADDSDEAIERYVEVIEDEWIK